MVRYMDRLKILVVDDESRMRKLVRDFLVKSNFEVLEAEDGSQAVDIFFADKDVALIILDVMMPKMDGWEVCREIRAYSKVPIIMLTAKADERDELQGFDLGVDEYIAKPFSPKILVARVDAILRRTKQISQDDILEAGGIIINKAAHSVTIDGKMIDINAKELEILKYLLDNAGIALSRAQILDHVWKESEDVPYDRVIDVYIKELRKKLSLDCITTIRNVGYKLEKS